MKCKHCKSTHRNRGGAGDIKDVCLLAYFENQLHKEWEMKRRKKRGRAEQRSFYKMISNKAWRVLATKVILCTHVHKFWINKWKKFLFGWSYLVRIFGWVVRSSGKTVFEVKWAFNVLMCILGTIIRWGEMRKRFFANLNLLP